MNKNLIIIFLGLAFLTTSLIVGTPFEFLNSAVDALVTILTMLLICALFLFLFRLALRIEKKMIKRIAIGLICILAVLYSLLGIWTMMMISGNNPVWQDLSIYTNRKGEKVISEWRETSGSIYDYRYRKIIGDFGQFRISYNYDKKKLKGLWTEYNVGNNTTTIIDFEKELKEKTTKKN